MLQVEQDVNYLKFHLFESRRNTVEEYKWFFFDGDNVATMELDENIQLQNEIGNISSLW